MIMCFLFHFRGSFLTCLEFPHTSCLWFSLITLMSSTCPSLTPPSGPHLFKPVFVSLILLACVNDLCAPCNRLNSQYPFILFFWWFFWTLTDKTHQLIMAVVCSRCLICFQQQCQQQFLTRLLCLSGSSVGWHTGHKLLNRTNCPSDILKHVLNQLWYSLNPSMRR